MAGLLGVLLDLALVLPVRIVLRLALVDVRGATRACAALLLLVVLRLGLEDERLAGGQRGGVVRLGGQRGVVDRWQRLGLLELLVQLRLALLLGVVAASATRPQMSRTERMASSLAGMTQSMRSGSQFVSVMATIGISRRRASATAIASRCGSTMKTAPGSRRILRMPPRAAFELVDLLGELRGLLLREALELAGLASRLERLEALDAALDGL